MTMYIVWDETDALGDPLGAFMSLENAKKFCKDLKCKYFIEKLVMTKFSSEIVED